VLKEKLNNVKIVTAGVDYAAVLKKDGKVWTWGQNDYGQLGQGTRYSGFSESGTAEHCWCQDDPVEVKGLSNVIAIAAGGAHTVALKKDGSVWAWGDNEHGQIGYGYKNYRTSFE
jgi:alpha-tubulin suppressor-like RCC1 family protein